MPNGRVNRLGSGYAGLGIVRELLAFSIALTWCHCGEVVMIHTRLFAFAAIVLACSIGGTTTSFPTEKPDPLSDGSCYGDQPASYGGYIYGWPSKLDQVFWPHTEPEFIWFCPDSGFTAFLGDLELDPTERERALAYLADHYRPSEEGPSLKDKLRLLEDLYDLRDKDNRFRNWLLRALAHIYETHLDEVATANEYRMKALEQIETALNDKLEPKIKFEYLFLAARHSLLFDSQADAVLYQQELATAAPAADDDEVRAYGEYLLETLEEYKSQDTQNDEVE